MHPTCSNTFEQTCTAQIECRTAHTGFRKCTTLRTSVLQFDPCIDEQNDYQKCENVDNTQGKAKVSVGVTHTAWIAHVVQAQCCRQTACCKQMAWPIAMVEQMALQQFKTLRDCSQQIHTSRHVCWRGAASFNDSSFNLTGRQPM